MGGAYAAEDTLPSERELAGPFGVNRHAVREGFRRLQQLGLVKVSQSGATRVLDWREHAGLDLAMALTSDATPLPVRTLERDVLEMRATIGVDAARHASGRRGTIVNLFSVGGFASAPGFGLYAAVEGFTGALRDEVARLGITAGIVEPGYFRTDFLDDSGLQVSWETEAYAGTPAAGTRKAAANANHNRPGDPVKGAARIVETVDRGELPVRLFLSSDTIARVGEKLAAVGREIERQRAGAVATDHADR